MMSFPHPSSAQPIAEKQQVLSDKKERKKAQNRTAAFRYREKKKQEQEMADGEVETLVAKNSSLKAKLNDVENELRILKKLMTEAGLGKYANVVKL